MDYLEFLDADARAMADLAVGRLDAVVPACPGWTVEELLRHTGGVHRWSMHIVRGGGPRVQRQTGPEDADAVPEWFRAGAEELGRLFRDTDPNTPCWTIDETNPVAAYWHRRQALETVVHRVDLERALGITPVIDTELALDGIDEVVSSLYPRQVGLQRCEPVAAIRLQADDREFVLGEGDPVGTVSGPAATVFLALWHRADGDPDLSVSDGAAASLAAAVTP
ncbi:MAG TPA: maleylpyruvate isomerase family mycothiol-dependent enzyme [Mycobacteriales bacterium]|nr:maleylpyruvate isomerase family mycothiol-dependent enzyme [Mycobacteriales bacterium]